MYGLFLHPCWPRRGSPRLSDLCSNRLDCFSRFLRYVPLSPRGYAVCRTGPGSTSLLLHSNNPHHFGHYHSSARNDYSLSRFACRLRASQEDCPHHSSNLAIRLCDWRYRLPDAVSHLSLSVKLELLHVRPGKYFRLERRAPFSGFRSNFDSRSFVCSGLFSGLVFHLVWPRAFRCGSIDLSC